MTLLELHTDVRDLTAELRLSRLALESIAKSLLSLTEIPAQPPAPDKPMGPEAIGSYANALMAMEGEESDELRARLHAAGLSDEQIEQQVIQMFVSGVTGEESTE